MLKSLIKKMSNKTFKVKTVIVILILFFVALVMQHCFAKHSHKESEDPSYDNSGWIEDEHGSFHTFTKFADDDKPDWVREEEAKWEHEGRDTKDYPHD